MLTTQKQALLCFAQDMTRAAPGVTVFSEAEWARKIGSIRGTSVFISSEDNLLKANTVCVWRNIVLALTELWSLCFPVIALQKFDLLRINFKRCIKEMHMDLFYGKTAWLLDLWGSLEMNYSCHIKTLAIKLSIDVATQVSVTSGIN